MVLSRPGKAPPTLLKSLPCSLSRIFRSLKRQRESVSYTPSAWHRFVPQPQGVALGCYRLALSGQFVSNPHSLHHTLPIPSSKRHLSGKGSRVSRLPTFRGRGPHSGRDPGLTGFPDFRLFGKGPTFGKGSRGFRTPFSEVGTWNPSPKDWKSGPLESPGTLPRKVSHKNLPVTTAFPGHPKRRGRFFRWSAPRPILRGASNFHRRFSGPLLATSCQSFSRARSR